MEILLAVAVMFCLLIIIIIAIALVLFLKQMTKTAKEGEFLLRATREQLPKTMTNIDETLSEVKNTTANWNTEIDNLRSLLSPLYSLKKNINDSGLSQTTSILPYVGGALLALKYIAKLFKVKEDKQLSD